MGQIAALRDIGCSVYFDGISRSLIRSGEASRLVSVGVSGVTTNPPIFHGAISSSPEYDEAIEQDTAAGLTPHDVLWDLIVSDVRMAADLLEPIYRATDRVDGYVSIEVHPTLAHDAVGTLAAARELWARVGRPNAMIKIPATGAGLRCVRPLVADGVNVNVTVVATASEYEAIVRAYLEGLADRRAAGQPVEVAAVASLFLARIDTVVDDFLDALAPSSSPSVADPSALRGRGGIAMAKLAYRRFLELHAGATFASLRRTGARPVRLLWASTGPKDPAYPILMYAEGLVGPDTIFTLPPQVLAEMDERGRVRPDAIVTDVDDATATWDRLHRLGLDDRTVSDGVQTIVLPLFSDAMRQLENLLVERCGAVPGRRAPAVL